MGYFPLSDKQALDVIRAWNSMLVGMPEDSFRILDRAQTNLPAISLQQQQ